LVNVRAERRIEFIGFGETIAQPKKKKGEEKQLREGRFGLVVNLKFKERVENEKKKRSHVARRATLKRIGTKNEEKRFP